MKNKDIKDFYENDYFSYESDCDLWNDEKISLLIDFGEEADKSKMLMKHLCKINEILKWIDEHKKDVSDFLINKQCLALAEEWVITGEQIDENTYKNQSGEIINIPIKDEDFFNAMYIDTILIDFDEDETRPDTTLHILFEPDYFKHHSLIVYIDGERKIEYGDIAG
ncbi:DUF2262 domain-containing protein [Brachyspira innocens]|uniref:DUF2262 domain-containing protein n=1 Tax=Brachyspira innocens TaxID=13264 RepID=A0ABT8YZM4_9SPIR|nr:DUF2262 domain-containing protein [Brachyspira innocens]MDO6993774.1 DUF2262 domain-containing protein [Brachyspira innocens]MDO7020925.1 DUF2262 domain-containing protein [Brachyspira innocens]